MFSFSRGLGWSPESCPHAVTSRVFVRGEPVTGKKRKKRNPRKKSHALPPSDSSRIRVGVCARSSALASVHLTDVLWCTGTGLWTRRLCFCLVSFLFLSQHWDQESSAEVSTPLQECPTRRDRLSIDRSSIRPYGRCRSGTRVYRPWALELMDPYGKYLYWMISCVKLLHNTIWPLGPLAFDPQCVF